MANIYNEPGSTDVKITLKNNDYAYLNTNIGIAKMCLITNQKKFGYSDLNGNLKKCLTDASGSSVTPENCVFIADNEGSASHSTTFVYNDNKLGVNIAAPQNKAHFHEPSTGNCLIQITNTSRGSSDDNDGMTLGVVGDDNVIRTTYGFPVKIQVEDDDNPGTFVDLATFQNTGWHSNTILDTDLTVGVIPAKTAAASVFLTHEENTIKTRTADQVLEDIGAAAVSHTQAISTVSGLQNALDSKQPLDTDLTAIAGLTHSNRHVLISDGSTWTRRALVADDLPSLSISKITNLQTTLDDKQATITGTENKVLSIQAGGSGVKTGSIYDNGNVVHFEKAFIGNSLSTGIRHYHDVYLYSNSNSTETGVLKIVMPQGWTNTFMRITIKGYNYVSGQGAWECVLGGYNYNHVSDAGDAWYYTSAEIRGSAPFASVRLGYDGSKCVILLGNADTYWRYAKVAISDMMAGGAIYNWETGWSAEIITSETGLTKIATPITSIYGNNATIPNTALIGKTTATGGYRLEVEGNQLVNGTLKANSFVGQYESAVKHYHDVLVYNRLEYSISGIMKIVMPKTWSDTMLILTIKGYNYVSRQGAWECVIGGENNSVTGEWYNCSAEIRGSAPFSTVRLAHDGSKCVIILGETTTVWNYPKILISDLVVGQENTDGWDTGWSALITTSELTGVAAHPVTSIYGNNATIPNNALIEGNINVGGIVYLDPSKVKAGTSQAGAGAVAGELWRNTSTDALHLGI